MLAWHRRIDDLSRTRLFSFCFIVHFSREKKIHVSIFVFMFFQHAKTVLN